MQLQIKNLSKNFKKFQAVKQVSMTLEKGVYGLLGANGAGKTTLMRMLCSLLEPSSGMVEYNGEETKEMDGRYRRILGYLPQDFGYYPDFTAENYLMYIASLKGIKTLAARKRVKELMSIVSLTQVSKKKVKTFSGGMKRRLGIAQALLNNPEILILDEPTAGLDPKERIKFRSLISRISEERIVLLSTHIVSDIEAIAKEIIIMKDGSITVKGSKEELLSAIIGKTWLCRVNGTDADIIRKTHLVSNERMLGEEIELRIISSQMPISSAVLTEPTLEDLFIFYFGEAEQNADFEI